MTSAEVTPKLTHLYFNVIVGNDDDDDNSESRDDEEEKIEMEAANYNLIEMLLLSALNNFKKIKELLF